MVLTEIPGHLKDAETERRVAAMKTTCLLLGKGEADDANRMALVNAGAVPPFVAMLRDGNDVMREHAVEALCKMTIIPEASDACVEADALRPLVALLRDGSARTRRHACGAIHNILCDRDDAKDSIVALGAIPLIVAMIGDGSTVGAAAAVGALRNLSVMFFHRVEIVKAGCIPPLVAVLSAGFTEAKMQAVIALRNLSVVREVSICIAKAGAIPQLVACLSDDDFGDVAEDSAAALANLASEIDENKVAIVKAGGVAPLVALERDGSAESKQMATQALNNLTQDNVDNETAVAAARAVAEITAHKTLALEHASSTSSASWRSGPRATTAFGSAGTSSRRGSASSRAC